MTLHIDTDSMIDFLVELLNVPSPTGDTERAMAYVRQQWDHLPLRTEMTAKGALVATWEGGRGAGPAVG